MLQMLRWKYKKRFCNGQDLIIEVIYADIVTGKLDQKNQQLEVDCAIGRDIRPEQVTDIVQVLETWFDSLALHLLNVQYMNAAIFTSHT